MKRTLRYAISVLLVLSLMLTLGVVSFADSELPLEYVAYGYGLPDAAGVDKHDLGDDDITIEGVSWNTTVTDEKIYVSLVDLAAAKLLRESTDKAEELGIDYSKLYINGGLIMIKDDVASDEAATLKTALAQLTGSVAVAVSTGDRFDVGNGGTAKLQVEVSGFVYPSEAPAENYDVAVEGINYNYWNDDPIEGQIPETIERTTVYVIYGGVTYYNLPVEYGAEPEYSETAGVGIAKAENDPTEHYYIRVISPNGSTEYVEKADLSEFDWDNADDYVVGLFVETEGGAELATQVLISTDGTDAGIVETINVDNVTPTLDEVFEGELPEGYEVETYENEIDFFAKEFVTVEENGNTDNVTVKDDVIVTFGIATDEYAK